MSELLDILMARDGLDKEDAQSIIDEMRERVAEGENPDDVLYDHGLEPDYFMELI